MCLETDCHEDTAAIDMSYRSCIPYRLLRMVLLMLVTACHLQALKALLEADTADYRVAAQVQVANAAANGSVTAPTPKGLMSPGDSETPAWAQRTEIMTSESVNVHVFWLLHHFVIGNFIF